MKLHRIYANVLRYFYLFRHNLDRLTDAFYWPTVDLVLWGIASLYFRSYLDNAPAIVAFILSGVILWIIVWRGQAEISVNVLEEIWNRNLINIFVAPLKFSEWILSLLAIGAIKAFASFLFAVLVAFLLYKVQIFSFGFYLVPFIIPLLLFGYSVGFFISGLVLRFGTRIQGLSWSLIFVISPFSAIYYPLEILPAWAQNIASFIPASYIFEGAREVLMSGVFDQNKVFISVALSVVYFVAALLFFRQSFYKALKNGLTKVY
ncbi:MAG: ABC transporter permease [bacterium]|nr:ABC transporter permease [bacterium]